METSNLFSHPDAPESDSSGESSTEPAEYPTFSDRPEADTAARDAVGVNGISGARRVCPSLRMALAACLGPDIDGGRWSHTNSLASELPELVEGFASTTGSNLDIRATGPRRTAHLT